MTTLYQTVCWLIVSALGSLLVCSLTVAGEQAVAPRAELHRTRGALPLTALTATAVMMMVCFPRYYAVGYGCIRLPWLLLATALVIQALANKFGRMQRISGVLAPLALGLALAPTIFGAEVQDALGASVFTSLNAWILAGSILFLSLFSALLRASGRLAGSVFGVLFMLSFLLLLTVTIGTYTIKQTGMATEVEPFGLLENLSEYWFCGFSLSVGIILMLAALMGNMVMKEFRAGYILLLAGAFLSYGAIICSAGMDDAAILPLTDDPQQSVTLANGSAPLSTLRNAVISTSVILIAIILLNFRNFAQNFTRK